MKKTSTYNEAEHEQDSRKMMERINNRKTDCEAAEQGASREKAAEQEKTRIKRMCLYIAACLATALSISAVFNWMVDGLIDPVLALPATYIGTGCLGWLLCKAAACFKRVVAK